MHVKMIREDGHLVDVHPDMIDHYRKGGYVETGDRGEGGKIELRTDSGDQFSDDQLRDIIEAETGKRPHHRTGRDKLVAAFNELNEKA